MNASNGIVYARLFNATSTDLILYKRTHIALFVAVFNTGDAVGIENENDDICHNDEKEQKTVKHLPQFMDRMYLNGIEFLSDK